MKNKYNIKGDITEIEVIKEGNTYLIIIDTEDLERVNKYKGTWWILSKEEPYCIGAVKRKGISLHRIIMNAPNDKVVNHINHNVLDNRKSNLEIVSQGQNSQSQYNGLRNKFWGCPIKLSVLEEMLEYFREEYGDIEVKINYKSYFEIDYIKNFDTNKEFININIK